MQFNKMHNKRIDSIQFKLSQKIFTWRISHNLSKKEVANLITINITKYTKIEQGIWPNEYDYQLVLERLNNANSESFTNCHKLNY